MRGVIIAQCGLLSLTSWGRGTAYTLRHEAEGTSVFFQGDDAGAFRDELEAEENAHPHDNALPALWERYGELAQEDRP